MTDIENRDIENRDVKHRDVKYQDKPGPRADKPVGTPAVPPSRSAHGIALLPQDTRDKLTLRLQHAVTGFVDGPQDSVEEADRVLAEVTERFTEAVERTRRTLRGSWQPAGGTGSGTGDTTGDTEKLRLALRDYRELAERLLHS